MKNYVLGAVDGLLLIFSASAIVFALLSAGYFAA